MMEKVEANQMEPTLGQQVVFVVATGNQGKRPAFATKVRKNGSPDLLVLGNSTDKESTWLVINAIYDAAGAVNTWHVA